MYKYVIVTGKKVRYIGEVAATSYKEATCMAEKWAEQQGLTDARVELVTQLPMWPKFGEDWIR